MTNRNDRFAQCATHTIELDIAFDNGLFEGGLLQWMEEHNIGFRLIMWNGPAGNWPIIEFSSDDIDIMKLMLIEWFEATDDFLIPEIKSTKPGRKTKEQFLADVDKVMELQQQQDDRVRGAQSVICLDCGTRSSTTDKCDNCGNEFTNTKTMTYSCRGCGNESTNTFGAPRDLSEYAMNYTICAACATNG